MTTINIRIDEKTKNAARKIIEKSGLDLSFVIKNYLDQIIQIKEVPFISTPKTRALRKKWDADVADAKVNGKKFDSAREFFTFYGKE